jgi:integrase/recombinase XerD
VGPSHGGPGPCSFYAIAVVDGLIEHSPAEHVRRPRVDAESTTLGLDRTELAAFVAQGSAGSPTDHALACVLGILGLRVSEACSLNIEDISTERGHRTIRFVGKGSKPALMPLPPRVARTLDLVVGERHSGPVLLTRAGNRLNRHAATRIVRRPAKGPGSPSGSRRTRFATALSPPP